MIRTIRRSGQAISSTPKDAGPNMGALPISIHEAFRVGIEDVVPPRLARMGTWYVSNLLPIFEDAFKTYTKLDEVECLGEHWTAWASKSDAARQYC